VKPLRTICQDDPELLAKPGIASRLLTIVDPEIWEYEIERASSVIWRASVTAPSRARMSAL
jgi:hypothetical protein